MFNWLKQDKSQSPVEKFHTEDREQKVKEIGVSEPVLAIVKSFKEPNRWSYRNVVDDFFSLRDNNTGYEITFRTRDALDCMLYNDDRRIIILNPPVWMTNREKNYLGEQIHKWYTDGIQKIKDNKRNEVKKLYSVEN